MTNFPSQLKFTATNCHQFFKHTVSPIRYLSGLKIFPAMLNKLSTGVEEAGMQRYFSVSLANLGNSVWYSLHASSGLAVEAEQSSSYTVPFL